MSNANELESLLTEWESETQEQLSIQTTLLSQEQQQLPHKSDLLLISHIQSQQHELTQLKLSERLQREHAIQLQQLIEEKHASSEQQLRFLKSQHTTELTQYQQQLEATIAKNLSMIETLVADKKQLADELETLSNTLETEKTQSQTKIRRMKEHFESEMKNFKESQVQKERIEREKWQKDKTAKIRELTIKGLEPELQSLIQRHQLELQQAKLEYQAKLLAYKQEHSILANNNESTVIIPLEKSLLANNPVPFYSGLHSAVTSPDVNLMSKKFTKKKTNVVQQPLDTVIDEEKHSSEQQSDEVQTRTYGNQSRYAQQQQQLQQQPFASSQLLFQPPAIFMQSTNSSLPAIGVRQSINNKYNPNHSSVTKRKNNKN